MKFLINKFKSICYYRDIYNSYLCLWLLASIHWHKHVNNLFISSLSDQLKIVALFLACFNNLSLSELKYIKAFMKEFWHSETSRHI